MEGQTARSKVTMSQSKQRIALLIAVVIPLVVGVIAHRSGGVAAAIPPAFAIALLVIGAWAILGAVLLKFHLVRPGRMWGHSAAGSLLVGAGCLLWGIADYLREVNYLWE